MVRGRHVSCATCTHCTCTQHDRANLKNAIIKLLSLPCHEYIQYDLFNVWRWVNEINQERVSYNTELLR